MALTIIGSSVTTNGSLTTVFTCPAGYQAVLGSVVVSNSSGGALNITLSVKRLDGTTYKLVDTDAVADKGTNPYCGNSSKRITPLSLQPGEVFQGQASGASVTVTYSGFQKSTS